jgi:hypothetical protein
MTDLKTFNVSEDGDPHEVGNLGCQSGWCASYKYPILCECGGLIHADFGDEDYDCNYWLYTKCDKCGRAEYE